MKKLITYKKSTTNSPILPLFDTPIVHAHSKKCYLGRFYKFPPLTKKTRRAALRLPSLL